MNTDPDQRCFAPLYRAGYRRLKGGAMSDLADVDVCQITSGIVVSVISLLESHPLRAMDALHVACVLVVTPDYIAAADHRPLSAAQKAGLKIVDVSATQLRQRVLAPEALKN